MIIARFGDAWSGAYQLSTYKAEDDWGAERSQAIQQIGGAAGAFDFYGDENFPVAPLTVRKKFDLTSSTYAGIETALDTLRGSTIAAGRTKLWGVLRDGSTHRWAWAKCTRLNNREVYGGQYLNMPIELEFICPEGVWYAESESSVQRTGAGVFPTATNSGNVNALVRCTIAGGTTPTLNLAGVCAWLWTGTISGTGLVVDAQAFECTNDGADAYANLTPGTGQVAWFWLPPGNNTVSLTLTGSYLATLYWYSTYVL